MKKDCKTSGVVPSPSPPFPSPFPLFSCGLLGKRGHGPFFFLPSFFLLFSLRNNLFSLFFLLSFPFLLRCTAGPPFVGIEKEMNHLSLFLLFFSFFLSSFSRHCRVFREREMSRRRNYIPFLFPLSSPSFSSFSHSVVGGDWWELQTPLPLSFFFPFCFTLAPVYLGSGRGGRDLIYASPSFPPPRRFEGRDFFFLPFSFVGTQLKRRRGGIGRNASFFHFFFLLLHPLEGLV